jgi:hypothetical protein
MTGAVRSPSARPIRSRSWVVGAFVALAGCDRGCDGCLGKAGTGATPSLGLESLPLRAVDCPDGLARCENGVVSVSRLAILPMPCPGPPGACTCPWETVDECASGCAADGVELTVERARARTQLCAPGPDDRAYAAPLDATPSPPVAPAPWDATPSPPVAPAPCEEGERYRCAGGHVIECASNLALGRCVKGCFAEGTSIGDDAVSRETAFAILCSR